MDGNTKLGDFVRFFAVFVFLSQFFIISSAFAYIDPGTGSYLLQIIIGFILAGLYAVKHYWTRLCNCFTKKIKTKKHIP